MAVSVPANTAYLCNAGDTLGNVSSHPQEFVVDAVDAVEVGLDRAEAGALVDLPRSLIEDGNREGKRLCAELGAGKGHAGRDEIQSVAASGQIRAQAETDFERRDLVLELEEADQVAGGIDDLEIPAAAKVRVEKISQVGIVRDGIVEVVGRRILPARDRLGRGIGHLPDGEPGWIT